MFHQVYDVVHCCVLVVTAQHLGLPEVCLGELLRARAIGSNICRHCVHNVTG